MEITSEILTKMYSRRIIHVDMDAFYASVEQRDRPELRGKPIAVGHEGGRGVVAAASYEARRYGVRSAMPSSRARRLCPQLIFVDGRMSVYKEVSGQVHSIFRRYTDIIEPLSLDEAFLDVTVNKPNLALGVDIARNIKKEIRQELGLVASAGVSYCKFLAKVASDYRKPDGLCTIHPDRAADFIGKLKVEEFWGVGPVTAKKMHSLGIHTGADIRKLTPEILIREFGKAGQIYYDFSRGIDLRDVETEHIRKSVGTEHTFDSDSSDFEEIDRRLELVADELIGRLERHPFQGTTLTLKVRFSDFTDLSRSITENKPFVAKESILKSARTLMTTIEAGGNAIRLIGLSVSRPYEEKPRYWRQLTIPFREYSDLSDSQ